MLQYSPPDGVTQVQGLTWTAARPFPPKPPPRRGVCLPTTGEVEHAHCWVLCAAPGKSSLSSLLAPPELQPLVLLS